ncbi:MAG: FCD domain-containing protein [Streptosporangiales bacterium]|nr:FCD domain-containing protein [Streptosporangiales bacterium]
MEAEQAVLVTAKADGGERPRRQVSRELLSAKEWCVDHIRAMIYAGELEPARKILIDELARDLGVSRTPVRDALWHLQREGLVTVAPRVGVYVREISRREVEDIYQLKVAIEPLMAQWAAERGTADDKAAYREAIARLVALGGSGDVEQYVEHLQDCRRLLIRLAGSDALTDMNDVVDGRVRLLRFRNLSQAGELGRSARQHERVAEAIVHGDGAGAHDAMRDHMADAATRIRRLLKAREDEQSVGEEQPA